jgi:hypothetical protein
MAEVDLEALIVAKTAKTKKKKKKKPTDEGVTGGGGGGGDGGDGGDVVKKKKKKKKQEGARDGGDDAPAATAAAAKHRSSKKSSTSNARRLTTTSDREYEKKASGGQQDEDAERRRRGRRKTSDDDDDGEGGGNRGSGRESGTMSAADAAAARRQSEKLVDVDLGNGDGGWGGAGGGARASSNYYAGVVMEADADVMAEINQEGLVRIDESGGIQAFVDDTIAIDDDAVGIIKSDAEVEREEKKKYTKYFCVAVAILVVIIAAVAIPLTLKFARGDRITLQKYITESPTDVPSMMPSIMPSGMPSSIRFMEIVKKLEPISGNALKVQGSSQYKAAMWMAEGDPIRNNAGGTGLDLDDPSFEQRYIMALFYYAMDGDRWFNPGNWLGPEEECFWFGIEDENGEGVDAICGGQDSGGCIKRGDLVGDFNKICRIDLSE